jgi:intergrase/recombinase
MLEIWQEASRSSGVNISSKVFRAWFNSKRGELGVPDRYVDAFQGRAPRSVLANHYTGKGMDRLKSLTISRIGNS